MEQEDQEDAYNWRPQEYQIVGDGYNEELEAEPRPTQQQVTEANALALAILNDPELRARLREIVHVQPAATQALVPVAAGPTTAQHYLCPDCGKQFKSSQGRGSHRKHCTKAPTAHAPVRSAKMHIFCVEGDTFLAGLFERHWQWTASIADDRLQFYTQHHLSGRSGGEVLARVRRMCMLDAQDKFPGKNINFTTSEKPRETHSLPWRPLEKAAKKAVRDNAVGLLTEAFKGLELKRK